MSLTEYTNTILLLTRVRIKKKENIFLFEEEEKKILVSILATSITCDINMW